MGGVERVILCFLLVLLGAMPATGDPGESTIDNLDGYPFLVQSIRYNGSSEEVLQSGRFNFVRTEVQPRPTGDEYERQYRDYVLMMKDRMKEVDDNSKALIEEAIGNAPELFEEFIQRKTNSVRRIQFVFEGVGPFQRAASEYHTPDESGHLGGRFVQITGTLDRGRASESRQFVTHHVDHHPGSIDVDGNTWGTETPNEFGRFRGRTSLLLNAFLLDESDIASGQLDEQKIFVGQELNVSVLRESGGEHGVRIIDREEIEGSTCVVVKTDDPGATNLRGWLSEIKVWIDPGRGFITPRIIEYLDGKPAVEYVSTNYQYLEDAGLWWPRVHEVTDHTEGTVVRYEIDLDRSCVNCPIAEEEFELTIEPGNHVTDNRHGKSEVLVVERPFQMKFERDGRLNFDSATGIARSEMPTGMLGLGALSRQSGTSWIVIINIVGIAMLLLGFRLRKWRGRGT